jgi:hypothetical protein
MNVRLYGTFRDTTAFRDVRQLGHLKSSRHAMTLRSTPVHSPPKEIYLPLDIGQYWPHYGPLNRWWRIHAGA